MFQYKPLEKSAKKEKDYTGQSVIRIRLRFMDFVLVPIERTYDTLERIPVLGRARLVQQDACHRSHCGRPDMRRFDSSSLP